MNRIITSALATIAVAVPAMADITVNVNPAVTTKEFDIEYGYLSDMVKPRADRPEANKAKATVIDGKFTLPAMNEGAAQYVIPTGEREYIVIYSKPGDNMTVNIDGISPLAYSVTGSKLMEDISSLDMESSKLLQQYRELSAAGSPDPAVVEKISNDYDKLFTDYVAANPDAEAVPYAIMHLEGQKFLDYYNAMTPAAKASPIALFLEPQKEYAERVIAAERRKVELQSGNVEAPAFTFDNLEGKAVSLQDFRGKWVIIDFWGSWCPWCIKGFPKLKDAYEQYKPELEILGVDCNEPEANWRKGVEKYKLPWVNVYNPADTDILTNYAVQGFPTKVIVSPEGKIANITVGENPAFFDTLAKLINGK